ncbi:hypothetical protein LCM4577_33175 [Mesorhizobium sp. LCM 4577]|nr:hypothetical protein LCM4577_33175 [Mesorhizobium sp. LCM 4577]
MSKMVAYLLDGQPLGEQANCTGMAQGMRAAMGSLNPERNKSPIGDAINASHVQGASRRLHAEEDFLARGWWPDSINIARQCFSSRRHQRIDLGLSSLQTEKPKCSPRPVDLVESQCGDFAAAHAIYSQQQ